MAAPLYLADTAKGDTGMMSVQIIQLLKQENRESKGAAFCLKQGQKTNGCTLSKDCYYSHQANNHHISFCPQKFNTTREFMKESVHLVEEISQEE